MSILSKISKLMSLSKSISNLKIESVKLKDKDIDDIEKSYRVLKNGGMFVNYSLNVMYSL